jgi:hypothetical protein
MCRDDFGEPFAASAVMTPDDVELARHAGERDGAP